MVDEVCITAIFLVWPSFIDIILSSKPISCGNTINIDVCKYSYMNTCFPVEEADEKKVHIG